MQKASISILMLDSIKSRKCGATLQPLGPVTLFAWAPSWVPLKHTLCSLMTLSNCCNGILGWCTARGMN